MGDFTNWQCYMGSWWSMVGKTAPLPGFHTIMDALAFPFYDETCPLLPKVFNGYRYSCRLGNPISTTGNRYGIEYELTVDSSNSLLLLSFAWVLDICGYVPMHDPDFTIKIRDSFGNMGNGKMLSGRVVQYGYDTAGDYCIFLKITDAGSCTDTVSKWIAVYPINKLQVYIPNTFTPNGDNLNDTWKPVLLENREEGYVLSIYDRWGQQVFHTTNPNDSWDGTINGKSAQNNTVYSYHLTVKDLSGKAFEYSGHVTVVR